MSVMLFAHSMAGRVDDDDVESIRRPLRVVFIKVYRKVCLLRIDSNLRDETDRKSRNSIYK